MIASIQDPTDPEELQRKAKEKEKQQHKLKAEQEIEAFFRESTNIVMQAPSGHKLKDIARYQVIVKDKTVPERAELAELDSDKKVCIENFCH